MKIFMLLFAGMLMVSVTAVNAQDTTQVAPPSNQTVQPQPSDQFAQKDYVQIKASEVPASLRTTLKGDEYKGWESGAFYRNKTSNGYLVRINDGTMITDYHFNKSGKRIEDPLKQ